jgi:multiple sugar transport system substrate-binding protein
MMIPKKAIAALAIGAIAAITLAGCSSGGSTPSDGSTVPAGKVSGDLTIWAQGTEGDALTKFLAPFEKDNPGLNIKVTSLPWDSAESKYQTAIAGGSGPDIGMFGTDWMSSFAGDMEETPAAIDTSGFYPTGVETTTIDGKKYGVPWYVDTRVVYYRSDLLKAAGYDSFPTDWDGFKALAKAMQTKAGAKYGISLSSSGSDSFLNNLPFVWSNGGQLINGDDTKWTLDSAQVIGAMTYLDGFFADGIADRSPSTAAGAPEAAFVDGSVPMLISGPWETSTLEQAGGAGFDDKFAVAPIPASKTSTSFQGGSNLVVLKDSKNKGAAWKLIQWLTTPSTEVAWYKAVKDLPSQKAAWDDPSLKDDPKVSVFGKQLESTAVPPAISAWTQVSAAADSSLEQIIKGGQDPTQVMKALQQKATSIGVAK